MPVPRRLREFWIFIGGFLLGLFGNLFAEFFVSWLYPEGVVPEKTALVSMGICLGAIISYIIVFWVIIIKTPEE